jgi:PAS domain S-box-containing protein
MADDCFAGGGAMGALMRAFDWSRTPLGPVEAWPQSLKTAVRIMLTSRYAMWMAWGPELTFFCNDAYQPTLGVKATWALGSRSDRVWQEIWPDIGPRIETVLRTGTATWDERLLLFLERSGFAEETYHTFSYSPLADDRGAITGMLCVVTEDTGRVLGERRLRTLRDLGAQATQAKRPEEACQIAVETLAENTADVPFALFYMKDEDGTSAILRESSQLEKGGPASPLAIDLTRDDPDGWPVAEVIRTGRPVHVPGVFDRFGDLPGGPWDLAPDQAMVLPIHEAEARISGALVLGISPCLAFDDDYRGFFELAVRQVSTTIGNARAYEEEKRRAEALAELDRAKTAFFSNVSHEFRTPLTLMLGPLADALAGPLEPAERERMELLHRNALRLQKLVNTLLDVSRIEAGRVQASYEPTDLAALTSELASVFRSAVERAGMRLIIDCRPLSEPVYVDRDMWEKVVLNLVSNAFKFTLDGEIEVALQEADGRAVLRVRDTGTGIPPEQLPHIFERFHRVEGARARTHEGTGIGLTLVQELVRLHGGTVEVESEFGEGTTFVVAIPLGHAHLPREQIGTVPPLASTALGADHYVEEALRWLPNAGTGAESVGAAVIRDAHEPWALDGPAPAGGHRPRILLADDNADLRDYLARLLSRRHEVVAVPDGEQALKALREHPPDLILTDVMMPGLDGFGLMKAVRSDPTTRTLPVIMLSARAGEEARVEGLEAGADDYLIKPFSARELLARVASQLELARVRQEVAAANERAATILESITDGFVALDRDWRFTYVNAEAERLNGVGRDELLGRDHWEAFPALVGTLVDREFHRAVAEGVEVEFENHYEPWDKWFEVRAYPSRDGGLSVFFRGVTARKRAERALAEARARADQQARQFDATLSAVQDYVFAFDGDGRFLYANKALLDLWGLPAEAAIGRTMAEIGYPEEVRAQVLATLRRVFESGQPAGDETPYTSPTGVAGHYEYILAPVFDADGAVVQVAGSARDVTKRRAAEEVLRQNDRRKNEFLAMLAHELRNPLAAIASAVSYGMMCELAQEPAWAMEIIARQLKHLTRLIDDLLDVSRISRGKIELRREVLDVAPALDAAVETMRSFIEEREHTLHVAIARETLWVDADATRLEQVVANLLTNAAKYSADGGQIWLSAARERDEVVIRVKDTGYGIPPERLPEMFELFAQGDRTLARSEGGLGIGLTVVKDLVEMHGGTVTAVSEGVGTGSEFTVRLPAAERPARRRAGARDGMRTVATAARRILIVDDSVDTVRGLARLLRLHGHEVATAYSGPQAIESALRLRPEVVVLDIGLPGMDGYEVASRLRAADGCADTLLVALSGYGQDEDRRKSKAAGFHHHLVKPVDVDALQQLLARAGRQDERGG